MFFLGDFFVTCMLRGKGTKFNGLNLRLLCLELWEISSIDLNQYGDVAQMVERSLCMREARGSLILVFLRPSANIEVLKLAGFMMEAVSFISEQLSSEDCDSLTREVLVEEVKQAVFSIGSDKAAGPDGYNSFFYKSTWDILSADLTKANQSAFVPKRCIAHNIMLAHELVKNYHRNNGTPRCLLKIDLRKAYDSISWDFVEEMLIGLNFPNSFITLVMNCIRTPTFSVSWNGNLGEKFSSSKGLRQGDPMSPLIFVMCMDYLSKMLSNVNNDFQYHSGCKKLNLNHLIFADDLLLFCHGDKNSIAVLNDKLKCFKETSGLSVNVNKSQLFCCNVDNTVKDDMLRILGFKEGILPMRYLGIPLISTRLTKEDCKGIVKKITGRIHSWTSKSLSYAGRIQLINSVLMSMHIFWACILLLPKSVCKDIQRICARFLWSGKNEGNYNAMVSWEDISKQKSEGGLGVKNIHVWNKAAITKHIWQIYNSPDSLWVKWIKINKIKDRSFWKVNCNDKASWIWRGILKIRPDARKVIDYRMGDGSRTEFWNDPWIQGCTLMEKFPRVKMKDTDIQRNTKVAALWRNNRWDLPDPSDEATDEAWDYIKLNYSLNCNAEDKIEWKVVDHNNFSISKTWKEYKNSFDGVPWFKIVWGKNSIPRHNFILWLALKCRLKTKDKLKAWGVTTDDHCELCGNGRETIDHCFFDCTFAAEVWRNMRPICRMYQQINSWRRLISWFTRKATGKSTLANIRRVTLAAVVYTLWNTRNRKIFLKEDSVPSIVVKRIRSILLDKFNGYSNSNTLTRVKVSWVVSFWCKAEASVTVFLQKRILDFLVAVAAVLLSA
ncbi:uncharacterized protein LOC126661614 [Mercurialis annua]|uniref:uncharacterized protein LOC126661614 n=1 Tax=Mercurialis annua TaxID=3986 RepID=UPI0021607CD0|nr:uncharacterized protein LOC126661614 [Mercurialis annua]